MRRHENHSSAAADGRGTRSRSGRPGPAALELVGSQFGRVSAYVDERPWLQGVL